MELRKARKQEAKHGDDHKYELDNYVPYNLRVVVVLASILVGFQVEFNRFYEVAQSEDDNVVDRDIYVKKQQQEVFTVPEAYAVVYPRAVVVHV